MDLLIAACKDPDLLFCFGVLVVLGFALKPTGKKPYDAPRLQKREPHDEVMLVDRTVGMVAR